MTLHPIRRCLPALLLLGALLLAPDAAAQTTVLDVKDSASTTRFQVNDDGGLLSLGTFGTGTIPASGAGARLMWHPAKAAFRAGFAFGTEWDEANVGDYSVAMGRETTASGRRSMAMGSLTTASGEHATAMGRETTASGFASTAMGSVTTAGHIATAMGAGTTASGAQSTAMGRETTASGNTSTAMGHGTTAQAYASLVLGRYNIVSGNSTS